MINQYVFGLVLALSSLTLILAMYLSLDSIISEVHDLAWISRASLLLAMGLLWYLLANIDRFFKDSLIDLLVHPRVLNQICWFYEEWNYEIYLTMFLIEFSIFCCNFDFGKSYSNQNYKSVFGYIQYLHFDNTISP